MSESIVRQVIKTNLEANNPFSSGGDNVEKYVKRITNIFYKAVQKINVVADSDRRSLIMPIYYADVGDVGACINSLIEITSNPNSGVSKECVNRLYNCANCNHALNEAKLEQDPLKKDVWFNEAKYYSEDDPVFKLVIDLKRYLHR